MVSDSDGVHDALDISFKSSKLEDPHVTAVEISNVGKEPVLRGDFTENRSLQFGLTVPIITILSAEHEPDSAPRPVLSFNGNLFEFEPELIVRNEIIRVSLLTEGRPGEARVSLNPFGAIEVQVRDRAIWLRQRIRRSAIISTIGLTVAAATIATVITSASNSTSGNNSADGGFASLQAENLDCSAISSGMSLTRSDLAELMADYTVQAVSGGSDAQCGSIQQRIDDDIKLNFRTFG